jgi:sugar lactone lactonase YvrE
MHSQTSLLVGLALLLTIVVSGDTRVEAQASGTAGVIDRLSRLYAEDPRQLHLAYYLASIEARAGRADAALGWLNRLAELDWNLGLLEGDFGALASDSRFIALATRLQAAVRATAASEVAFRLAERNLIPEGIAYDPTSGDFLIGSLMQRKIVRVSRQGKATDFVPAGSGGLGPVLGLEVDVPRRRLWAVSSGEDSAIFAFDLASGSLIGRYSLAAGGTGAALNDLCVGPTGTVYSTATGRGSVVALAAGTHELVELVPPGALASPNGIVCWPHGQELIVADSLGLAAVAIAGGNVRRLAAPPGSTAAGIDGLELHGETLVGVQNAFGRGRVVAVKLAADRGRILDVRALETAHPAFDLPTTGAVVGDSFYYIANSQLDHLDASGRLLRAEEVVEPIILRLRLL